MERLRAIRKVSAEETGALVLDWTDGAHVTVDLTQLIRQEAFKSLQDRTLFRQVALGDWGHSIHWPDGTELGADSLWRLCLKTQGKHNTAAFLDWRMRHGLSLSDAAAALGLSRRMVAYYSSGEREIPRTVMLACKGWETEVA